MAAPRMLVVARGGATPPEVAERRRLRDADALPDPVRAEERLGGTTLGEPELAEVPGLRGRVLRRLPASLGLALEAWRRRRDYDAVLTWTEGVAFPVAALMALTPGPRAGHIGTLFWPLDDSSPSRLRRLVKRVAFPPLARRGIDRLWVTGPLQRRLVAERWGIAPERILGARLMVDTRFWRPMDGPGDTICSVGREMRDYATLLEALEPLGIPCHIAAGTNALSLEFGSEDARAQNVGGRALPAHVTAGPLSPAELRDLYRRSRFVVLPILPSECDNGVTAIYEAMAMGRAVLTTDTAGRSDILEDGVNCVLVAPGDPEAMRAAIAALWADPERCARLGAAGRARVEAEAGIDRWVRMIQEVAADVAPGRR